MPIYVNTFFETRLRSLCDLAEVVEKAFSAGGIDYRVVGGLATYLYVEEASPDAGRLTKDIDIAVRRADLQRIAAAVDPYGLQYRYTAGLDMLVQADKPSTCRAVHMYFSGELVKADSIEPTSDPAEKRTTNGVRLMPLEDLLRMKLTSFRVKDQMHIKDLQEAGLITPQIERAMPTALRDRLLEVLRRD